MSVYYSYSAALIKEMFFVQTLGLESFPLLNSRILFVPDLYFPVFSHLFLPFIRLLEWRYFYISHFHPHIINRLTLIIPIIQFPNDQNFLSFILGNELFGLLFPFSIPSFTFKHSFANKNFYSFCWYPPQSRLRW